MSTFEPATPDEILEIAKLYVIKCSPEDPIQAPFLSSCIDTFAPYWLEIVNFSLQLGDMDGFKSDVLLLPLIKELNSTVDTDNFKNYRPVSNLLSQVVQRRLEQHMNTSF